MKAQPGRFPILSSKDDIDLRDIGKVDKQEFFIHDISLEAGSPKIEEEV